MNNKVQVVVEGRSITLVGAESEAYIKSVADYINEKFAMLKKSEGAKCTNTNIIPVLTAINVADDYFKEIEKNISISEEMERLKLENGRYMIELKNMEKLKQESLELKGQCAALYDQSKKLKDEVKVCKEELKKSELEKNKMERDFAIRLERAKMPQDKIADGYRAAKKYGKV